jgi:large subunit ribosomal protein L9
MKVILLKDVAKIGRRFDVVDVSDGYALNKLIPKNLAQAATGENLKRLQNVSAKVAQDRETQESNFKEIIASLKDIEVTIEVEANNEGRMFQGLKAETIAEAVKAATGHTMTAEHFVLKTPIKSLGEHKVSVHSGDQEGEVTLSIIHKSK